MHTLIAVEFVSLDGVMQSPGRPDEDTSGGFDRGGWAFRHLADDPEGASAAMAGQGETVGLVFGHTTYLDLVGHWLSDPAPNPFADILRATPKYVATRNSAAELPHPNTQRLTGEAVQTIAALKSSGDGELVLLGSATLLHSLQEADLIDGYILTVVPVVLGAGRRLFSDKSSAVDLRLERGVVSPGGTFVGDYRRS